MAFKMNLHLALKQQLNTNTLAITLKTATILAATIIIFYQDLAIIANDALQTEFMSHILAIPLQPNFTELLMKQ